MDYPRRVDGLAFAVEKVEYYSTDEEGKNDERGKPEGVPTDHHCDMIECKTNCAENARVPGSNLSGQSDKTEAAKDKFLEEGIAHRNIESDKYKIILCYADLVKR